MKEYLQVKKNKNAQRNSSFELLRIICIFMVIAGHYFTHGNYTEEQLMPLTFNSFYVQSLQLYARLACGVFVMITGYFMCQMRRKEGYYKKIISLLFEMYFYSISSLCIIVAINHTIPLKLIIQSMFPFLWGNWFVEYYLLLYALIPFINVLIEKLNREEHLRLLILILIMWSIVPTLTQRAWEFSNLDFMLVYYLLGAYIKKYITYKLNRKKLIVFLLILMTSLELSMLGFNILGNITNNYYFVEHAGYLKEYSSILSIPIAIIIFLIFKDFSFYSKSINIIASTVLGVYLLSDNFLMQGLLWRTIFPNVMYIDVVIIHSICKISIIFASAVIVDLIRQKICIIMKIDKLIDLTYENARGILKKVENRLLDMR